MAVCQRASICLNNLSSISNSSSLVSDESTVVCGDTEDGRGGGLGIARAPLSRLLALLFLRLRSFVLPLGLRTTPRSGLLASTVIAENVLTCRSLEISRSQSWMLFLWTSVGWAVSTGVMVISAIQLRTSSAETTSAFNLSKAAEIEP